MFAAPAGLSKPRIPMKPYPLPALLLAAALPMLAADPQPLAYPSDPGGWPALADLRNESPTMRRIIGRGRLIIGTGFEYRSLNARGADGKGCEGFIADYGRALAARLLGDPGKIAWRLLGERPLDAVTSGDVDVILDAIPKGKPGDPTSKVEFAAEFLRGGGAILIRKAGSFRSIGDIRNSTRILYPRTAAGDLNWLRSNAPAAHYVEFADAQAAFAALKAGEGDFLTADVPVLYDLASRDSEFTATSRYVDRPYSSIIARGDPLWKRYLVVFNEDLRLSGGYETLYQKWLFPLSGEMLR